MAQCCTCTPSRIAQMVPAVRISSLAVVASHRHQKRTIMYQKRPGVFMADWWDADGGRHRKQFKTASAAREHEHRETALAHAERASREMKLAARSGSSRRSPSPRREESPIEPAKGKLGVMIPGMGAVATTFVAGVEAVRKGLAKPIGSLTQMGTVRLGKRTDSRSPKVKEFVPLAALDDLVFTGWDIFEDNMYEAATKAGVLDYRLVEQLKPFLSSIKPRPAVFDHNYVKKIDGPNVKKGKTKMDLAEQLRQDIRDFKKSSGASRLITMWCGSTESYIEPTEAHQSLKAFEKALRENDEMIAPSMMYAYASLMEGVPFANGAPNLTVDLPVMLDLVLLLDLAKRCEDLRGLGIQEWLSFYFKSPMTVPGLYPEHDLFIQLMKLKNTLRHLRGEELITHLGLEYYD